MGDRGGGGDSPLRRGLLREGPLEPPFLNRNESGGGMRGPLIRGLSRGSLDVAPPPNRMESGGSGRESPLGKGLLINRVDNGGMRVPLPLPPSPQHSMVPSGAWSGDTTEDTSRVADWLGLLLPAIGHDKNPHPTVEEAAAFEEAQRKGSYASLALTWLPADSLASNLRVLYGSSSEWEQGSLGNMPVTFRSAMRARPGASRNKSPTASPLRGRPGLHKAMSEANIMAGGPSRRRSFAGNTNQKLMSTTSLSGPSHHSAAKSLRRNASEDILRAVVSKLSSDSPDKFSKAADDIVFLCASRYPRGFMNFGQWVWTARGADENRRSLGEDQIVWNMLLAKGIKSGNPDVAAKACAALGSLVMKSSQNVVAMIASPGMLVGLVDLLDSDRQPHKLQIQGWRVFQKCVSGVEDVKDVICNSSRFVVHLRRACMCSMEEVRMRAVSVVMNASTDANAQQNLNRAGIAEQALRTVMISSEDLMATRIRASIACANLVGSRESSVLTQAPEMLQELVAALQASWESREHAGVRWPLERMVNAVCKTAVSDCNKDLIVRFGALQTLLEIAGCYKNEVEQVYESTLVAIAHLTYHDDAKEQMNSEGFVQVMEDFRNEMQWTDMESTRQVALDIIFLLTRALDFEMRFLPVTQSTRNRGHVMASFAPGAVPDHVQRVIRCLKDTGIDVWSEQEGSRLSKDYRRASPGKVESLERPPMELVAEAMDLAPHIIVFVSRAYAESYKCRLEGRFAHIRERSGRSCIYYVMLEKDFVPSNDAPDGWLGEAVGSSAACFEGWDAKELDEVAKKIDDMVRTGVSVCWWDKEEEPAQVRTGSGRRRSLLDLPPPAKAQPKGNGEFRTPSGNGGGGDGSPNTPIGGGDSPMTGSSLGVPSIKRVGSADTAGSSLSHTEGASSVKRWRHQDPLKETSGSPAAVLLERFNNNMLGWITANNLDPLKDAFLYHALDEPSLLLKVPDDQLDTLTDRVGLRLRLNKAIERERSRPPHVPPPQSLSEASSEDAVERLHSGTHHSRTPSVEIAPDQSHTISRSSTMDSMAELPPPGAPVVLVGTGRLFAF